MTSQIGLISTATTTYNEPYDLARRFATIDHISGGRAGWNLVTSQVEDEAGNFGLDKHVDHALRYERAGEFYDVVAGLWDSWEADAFLHDKDSRPLLRHRQDAFPASQGRALPGPRPAERLPHAAGPAGGGAGRLVGGRPGTGGPQRRPGVYGARP